VGDVSDAVDMAASFFGLRFTDYRIPLAMFQWLVPILALCTARALAVRRGGMADLAGLEV
jgi:hypothetical protein